MDRKKITEIEISSKVVEVKVERFAFNRAKFKGKGHLFFVWMTLLMALWLALSLVEIAIKGFFALFTLFRDQKYKKRFFYALRSIPLPFGYLFGCLTGVISPDYAMRFLTKIDRWAPKKMPPIYTIVYSLFHRYRR